MLVAKYNFWLGDPPTLPACGLEFKFFLTRAMRPEVKKHWKNTIDPEYFISGSFPSEAAGKKCQNRNMH